MTSFLDVVRARRSCRHYKPDPVPREMVETILEAARLAPSACNRQPWRFAVVTDAARRARLVSEGFLPGLGMKWAAVAPVLLVMGMKRSLVPHRLAPVLTGVDYPLLDLGIAGEHAVLQAAALGLGTCWIGWISPKAVRRIVGWPDTILPQAVISLGWPDGKADPPSPRLPPEEIAIWLS